MSDITKYIKEDKSKGFFFHLALSYLPIPKTFPSENLEHKICTGCQAPLITLQEVKSIISLDTKAKNIMGVKADDYLMTPRYKQHTYIRKLLSERSLALTNKDTATAICPQCLIRLASFCNNDRTISNKLRKSARNATSDTNHQA